MLKRNTQFKEWLLPYVEGGLDETQRVRLEARLAEDPALAAEAARLRRTLGQIRQTAARVPQAENGTVPPNVWPRLRARLLEDTPTPVTAPRRTSGWWLAGVGAAAAGLTLAAFWLPGWQSPKYASHSKMPTVALTIPGPAPRAAALPPHPVTVLPHPAAAGTSIIAASRTKAPVKVAAAPKPAPAAGSNPFTLPTAPPVAAKIAAKSVPAANPSGALAKTALPKPLPPPVLMATRERSARRDTEIAPTLSAPAPVLGSPPATAPPLSAADQFQSGTARVQNGANGAPAAASVNALASSTVQKPSGGTMQAEARPKASTFNAPQAPVARMEKTAKRAAPGASMHGAFRTFAGGGGGFGGGMPPSLETWQAALSAAVQPPLWGETEGAQQANQALMAARESGMLDDLRTRLEARRTQSPRDVVTGRILAAVYEFGFSREPALRERRRIVGLEGAGGEDWFALAQAEEHAGNSQAARAAYRKVLESSLPPNSFHAAIARGRS